jgi:hypothetical protein
MTTGIIPWRKAPGRENALPNSPAKKSRPAVSGILRYFFVAIALRMVSNPYNIRFLNHLGGIYFQIPTSGGARIGNHIE